jgi:hypothetical protein
MLMEGKTAGAEEGFVGWLKPSHECKESGRPSLPQWQSIMRDCYSRSGCKDCGNGAKWLTQSKMQECLFKLAQWLWSAGGAL